MRPQIVSFAIMTAQANGVFFPIALAALALGGTLHFALHHLYLVIIVWVVFETITGAIAWHLSRETRQEEINDTFPYNLLQRERLEIRFATSADFPGTERVFNEWFGAQLSIDDAEFCEIMQRGSNVRVAEETVSAGSQTSERIVGYYSLWPIDKETFLELTSGKLQEEQLDSNRVLEITNPNASVIYVSEICVSRGSDVGSALLRDMIRYIPHLIKTHPQIMLVAAWPFTKIGRRLVKEFKMKPLRRHLWRRAIYQLTRAHVLMSPLVPKRPFSAHWAARF